MSEDAIVREYRPEDLDQILALVDELEAELAEKFPGVQVKPSGEDYRNRYLRPGTKYRTCVAAIGERVVGFLIGYPSLGAPEADAMFDVLPASSAGLTPEFFLQIAFVTRPCRSRGISKALHREMVEFARRAGFREVYTCIAKWNLPEIKVATTLGFERRDLGYRYRFSLKVDEACGSGG